MPTFIEYSKTKPVNVETDEIQAVRGFYRKVESKILSFLPE